jgi:O-antigen ligase
MRFASLATVNGITSSGRVVSWGRRLVLGASGGILILATLAYGAVHTSAYFAVGLLTATLSLALLTAGFYNLWTWPAGNRTLPYPPLWWLALGLGLLTLLQVMPWPPGVVKVLSPAAWEIRALGNGYGLAAYLPFSLNPYATMLEGLKLWPALVLFFLWLYTINTRQQLQALVGLILGLALFEVLYGFWHFHSRLIWGWQNPYSTDRLCGTFINGNHLAACLTMAILLGFGLYLAQGGSSSGPSGKISAGSLIKRWSRPEHLEPQLRRFLLLFLLLLLTVGLFFTGSRGGILSLAMGFSLMALLNWSQRWRKGHIIIIAVFLAAALLYSLFLGSRPALARFLYLEYEGRYQAIRGALALFREFPWLGSGLGTFGDLFCRYQPAEYRAVYFSYSHNDWLQLLAEAGIGGFLLGVAAWLALFLSLIQQWRRRRDAFARNLALGGLAAMGAVVFHSLGEFLFHIPAISLMFASIAAISYLTVHYHQKGGEYFSFPTLRLHGHGKLAALVFLALLGVQLAYMSQVGHYWLAELAAPTEVNSTRPAPRVTLDEVQRALRLNPSNSEYYVGLAGFLENGEGEAAVSKAENLLKLAVFHAPAYWKYRLLLAEFYLRQEAHARERYLHLALQELVAAVTLYPEYGLLHLQLALVLARLENDYTGDELARWRQRRAFHLEKAMELEPRFKEYFRGP